MSASLDAKSVLVIEDQFLIALDVERALRRAGATEVRLASSVRDALQALASFVPEAAVLDRVLAEGKRPLVAEGRPPHSVCLKPEGGFGS